MVTNGGAATKVACRSGGRNADVWLLHELHGPTGACDEVKYRTRILFAARMLDEERFPPYRPASFPRRGNMTDRTHCRVLLTFTPAFIRLVLYEVLTCVSEDPLRSARRDGTLAGRRAERIKLPSSRRAGERGR